MEQYRPPFDPSLPIVPAPWMAHRDLASGAIYYVNLQTQATTWTSPAPPKPPPLPSEIPCATCMNCPCECTDDRAKALAAVTHVMNTPRELRLHASLAEETAIDKQRRGHVRGVCVPFNRGWCRRGEDCHYEHSFTREAREIAEATKRVEVKEIPAAEINKVRKKQPCFDLKHKGFCGRGAKCPYAHTGYEGLPATRRERKAAQRLAAAAVVAEEEDPVVPVEAPDALAPAPVPVAPAPAAPPVPAVTAPAPVPVAPAPAAPPVRAVTAPAPARRTDDDDVVPQREQAPLPERRVADEDDGRPYDRPRRDYSRERPSPRVARSRERPSPRKYSRGPSPRRDYSRERRRGRSSKRRERSRDRRSRWRPRSRSRGRLFYA